MKKAVIILPTYNEVDNIQKIVENIFTVTKEIPAWEVHVVVVDSNSPDKTANLVDELIKKYKQLHLINTGKNGLGKAYIEGFKIAIEKLNPYVLFEMDADHSHDPKKIPLFLNEIEKGADFVIGSRYIHGGSIPANWGLHRKILSVAGNWIIRLGFMNLKIADWTSGYRAVKTWIIKNALSDIDNYTGYVFQVALLDTALKSKAIVKETPINFIDRVEGESKINSVQYTIHALLYVFMHSSFIRYVLVGVIGFIIDFGISFILIDLVRATVWLSTIVSAETAIISNFILNNNWSFAHKKIDSEKQSMWWSFFKFNLIGSGSLLIQALGMEGAVAVFGIKWWFVYKFFIIAFIIIPYSYFLYNKIVWKDK